MNLSFSLLFFFSLCSSASSFATWSPLCRSRFIGCFPKRQVLTKSRRGDPAALPPLDLCAKPVTEVVDPLKHRLPPPNILMAFGRQEERYPGRKRSPFCRCWATRLPLVPSLEPDLLQIVVFLFCSPPFPVFAPPRSSRFLEPYPFSPISRLCWLPPLPHSGIAGLSVDYPPTLCRGLFLSSQAITRPASNPFFCPLNTFPPLLWKTVLTSPLSPSLVPLSPTP